MVSQIFFQKIIFLTLLKVANGAAVDERWRSIPGKFPSFFPSLKRRGIQSGSITGCQFYTVKFSRGFTSQIFNLKDLFLVQKRLCRHIWWTGWTIYSSRISKRAVFSDQLQSRGMWCPRRQKRWKFWNEKFPNLKHGIDMIESVLWPSYVAIETRLGCGWDWK